MSRRLNRRGATLPLSLLVLVMLGFSVAVAYARLSSERRITTDAQAQMNAFTVAQSGLARYMELVSTKPAASPADIVYNDLPNGTATITIRMLRESTTTLLPAVYVISSRGTNTTAKRFSSLAAPAQRTVATYALWTPTPFDLNGALTSLTGVDKSGVSGALDGNDHCVAAGGNQPPIAGVALPTGGYTGQTSPINGNPDDTPVGLGTGGPGGSAKDQVSIDWAGIVAGTQLPPNYTYPSWPGPITSPNWAQWPVVKVNGDLLLPTSGKGILIVTGDLRINGAVPPLQWDGIVLIGGVLDLNGNSAIYGAAITGLNVKLGNTVPNYTIASGTKIIQYDSCNLNRALSHIGSLQRVRNGWTDTWSSY
jgi:type II secretory pathway pseudopilin PulG